MHSPFDVFSASCRDCLLESHQLMYYYPTCLYFSN